MHFLKNFVDSNVYSFFFCGAKVYFFCDLCIRKNSKNRNYREIIVPLSRKKRFISNTMIILMINVKYLFWLALATIVLVSCARIMSKSSTRGDKVLLTPYASVNADEFQSLIADPTVQLLDVRTQEEFDEGHIAGALLVDVNDSAFVEKAMAVLDVNRAVAVYCRSGRRSARAASLLSENRFKVTNLNGGVIAWQDSGKVLVK